MTETANKKISKLRVLRAGRVARNVIWANALVASSALIVALIFSLILAGRIVRPIQRFMEASRKILQGEYAVQVAVQTGDEPGQLNLRVQPDGCSTEPLQRNECRSDHFRADYLRYIGDYRIGLGLLREIIDGLGPYDRVETFLVLLRSFLHYNAIDIHHELTVCGAYLDRMFLGTNRLNEICETSNYHCCEYYLNPRAIP